MPAEFDAFLDQNAATWNANGAHSTPIHVQLTDECEQPTQSGRPISIQQIMHSKKLMLIGMKSMLSSCILHVSCIRWLSASIGASVWSFHSCCVAVRFLRNGTDYLGFCDFLKSDAYGVLKDVAVPLGLRRAGSWKRKPAAEVENEVHAV